MPLKNPAHLLGKTAASIPNTQIAEKIEPTKGLRQMKTSSETLGLSANKTARTSPKNDTET